MRFPTMAAAAALVAAITQAAPRYVVYFNQYHTASLPTRDATAGITHVITAFAPSTLFTSGGSYTPFMPLSSVRALFDAGTKVCMAIGGWGDTAGFSAGSQTDEARKTYAANVAAVVDQLGYDCVDVDWEYPGGNGEDYKQVPNEAKIGEVDSYPQLLAEIKKAIGDRELSIAVPGKEGDMIAFTPEKVPAINDAVDFVNVMTYDLMNRRDSVTNHHTSITGSAAAIDAYIARGMPADKLNLGIAFYAKYFTTAPDTVCTTPTGCPTALLEGADGSDTGLSGAVTFETDEVGAGEMDEDEGGQWYWDAATSRYWTFDTPELVGRKFDEIVKAKGIGGVFAWSLGEDSYDWGLLRAMQTGVKGLKGKRAEHWKA